MTLQHHSARVVGVMVLGLLLAAALISVDVACQGQRPAAGGGEGEPEPNDNAEPNDNGAGAGDPAVGQVTYTDRCSSCHGDAGQDNGEVASDVAGADAELIQGVLTSEAHLPVPDLTEQDYLDLGAYLEPLGEQDNDNGAGALESPYETTAFSHPDHMEAFDCTTCHHTEPVDAKLAACDVCHLDEWTDGVPPEKEAMHTPSGVSEVGNAGCRACHNQTTEDGLWDCSFCHTALDEL